MLNWCMSKRWLPNTGLWYNVWARGEGGGLVRQSLEYLTPLILLLHKYNVQWNKYILGPSFNFSCGLFLLNSAWLAHTLPQMPYGRFILYSIEQNMSLSAGPPSSSLAVEAYFMHITGLRHFRDIKHTFNYSLNSCSHAQWSLSLPRFWRAQHRYVAIANTILLLCYLDKICLSPSGGLWQASANL